MTHPGPWSLSSEAIITLLPGMLIIVTHHPECIYASVRRTEPMDVPGYDRDPYGGTYFQRQRLC